MNQKLFEFLSSKGFTPMMSDYEEIRHLMSLEHCTPTERAFLDELREKGEFTEIGNICIKEGASILWKTDFTKSNLKELVNDTKTKAD